MRALGLLVVVMPDLPRIDVGENKQEMLIIVSYSKSVVSGTRSGSNDRTMMHEVLHCILHCVVDRWFGGKRLETASVLTRFTRTFDILRRMSRDYSLDCSV